MPPPPHAPVSAPIRQVGVLALVSCALWRFWTVRTRVGLSELQQSPPPRILMVCFGFGYHRKRIQNLAQTQE